MLDVADIPKPGKLTKLLFWGYLTVSVILSFVFAVAVLVGATPVYFNGQEMNRRGIFKSCG